MLFYMQNGTLGQVFEAPGHQVRFKLSLGGVREPQILVGKDLLIVGKAVIEVTQYQIYIMLTGPYLPRLFLVEL